MERLEGWLKQENLKGFLFVTSEVVGYRFGESDWIAFEAAIGVSDRDNGWFDYPLDGRVCIRLEVSHREEEGHVDVRIYIPVGDPCLREQIQVAWMIFNTLDVSSEVQLID
ncbi:hypothetical protein ACN3XK_72775 [Actinomadura welshii]